MKTALFIAIVLTSGGLAMFFLIKHELVTYYEEAPPTEIEEEFEEQHVREETRQENGDHTSESEGTVPRQTETPDPTNLALPVDAEDIDLKNSLVSPYGIIRHSKDMVHGHGGIDLPLAIGDSIYAVDDGTIITNELVTDKRGGYIVDLFIAPGVRDGEGWIFKYEHVTLEPGLDVSSEVKKGQLIAKSSILFGNNHVGLEYVFNNFKFSSDKICWVDQLEPTAKNILEEKFDQIKVTPEFIGGWETVNEEGYYSHRALLDTEQFPDGPQLCYTLGLDPRVTLN